MSDQQRDARECPTWVSGQRPRTHGWAPADRPRMQIHVEGAWRWATVRQRQDWPDGRVAYQVDILLPDPEFGRDAHYIRSYWWDPETVRPSRHPAIGWQLRHTPGTGGAILHRDDCPDAGGGKLDRAAAFSVLQERNISGCRKCRPEADLT
ncbi:DUF6233 domain-containing protein [Streptomyces sp. NPDC026673]|uniref:DUF6233 domain-containing protein n=1 Tax=Streptomyces sp. NPDC026673 TaxID=3155724 RepID=UPI003404CA86